MILYAVNLQIQADAEVAWLDYMQNTHIPDVLQTICFQDCKVFRVLEPISESGWVAYRIHYRCLSQSELSKYREQFAAKLQEDHTKRFWNKLRATREVLEEVQEFGWGIPF